MKVYELRFHDYEFYHTVGVFESKEDAEKIKSVGIAALDYSPPVQWTFEFGKPDSQSGLEEEKRRWQEERFTIVEIDTLPPGTNDWSAKDIIDILESEGWEMADWFNLPLEEDED